MMKPCLVLAALSLFPFAALADVAPPDEELTSKGFQVEIKGQDSQANWRKVYGGAVTIEVTDATVGSDEKEGVRFRGQTVDEYGNIMKVRLAPCRKKPALCLYFQRVQPALAPSYSNNLIVSVNDGPRRDFLRDWFSESVRANLDRALLVRDIHVVVKAKRKSRAYTIQDAFPTSFSSVENSEEGGHDSETDELKVEVGTVELAN